MDEFMEGEGVIEPRGLERLARHSAFLEWVRDNHPQFWSDLNAAAIEVAEDRVTTRQAQTQPAMIFDFPETRDQGVQAGVTTRDIGTRTSKRVSFAPVERPKSPPVSSPAPSTSRPHSCDPHTPPTTSLLHPDPAYFDFRPATTSHSRPTSPPPPEPAPSPTPDHPSVPTSRSTTPSASTLTPETPLDPHLPPYGTCWNCGRYGHQSNRCPYPANLHCFGCGYRGVLKSECPRCVRDWATDRNYRLATGAPPTGPRRRTPYSGVPRHA